MPSRALSLLILCCALALAGEPPSDLAKRLAAGEAAALRDEAEAALRVLLAAPPATAKPGATAPAKFDLATIVHLAAQRGLARLGVAAGADATRRGDLAWLADTRQFGVLLGLAVGAQDRPDGVLAVLAALRARHAAQLDDYAPLATALCVVWDDPAAAGMAKADGVERALLVFEHHLAAPARGLVFDSRRLPWQLCVHLADCKVGAAELAWAMSNYRGSVDLERAFFDVPYDKKGLYSGEWQGIKGAPYTLENIRRLGGVCKDQAFFASQVGKALGIPTSFCTGASGRGEGFHAWLGFLKTVGKGLVMDFNAARYAEHDFWSARIADPQSGETLSDADIAMLPELAAAPLADQLASVALVAAADLAEPARRDEIFGEAIFRAPGNRHAWLGFVDAAAAAGEAEPALRRLQEPLRRFAGDRFDEFAAQLFTRLIRTLPVAQAAPMFDRAASQFRDRPDLQARFHIAVGDVLADQGKTQEALAVYHQVLADINPRTTPMALEAIDRIDAALRTSGDLKRLAETYRIVWSRLAKPKPSGYAWTTTWYIVGDHYAKLLGELGRTDEATAAQKQLKAVDTSVGRKPDEATGAKKPGE